MPSKPEEVLKDLQKGKYAPVYFLQGEEPFFIDQITDFIENNALAEHEKGFNQIVMYGKDCSVNEILTNAKRFPMMADRQVVIVKEAQNVADLRKSSGEKLLSAYLQNPLPSTILVFAHKYKSLDGKKSFTKELDKRAVLVKSEKIPEYKLSPWIEGYVKQKGFTIEANAAQLLAESIGNSLDVLSNEVDKMLINFKEPVKVTANHIQQFIGISKDYNNFELTKALSFKDLLKANKIIDHFKQNPKNNPLIPTINVLFNHFSRLLLVHANKGSTESELAASMKVHPYFIKEYLVAAKNYPLGKVIDNIGYLQEADLRSKGINCNWEDPEILRELVYKIMH